MLYRRGSSTANPNGHHFDVRRCSQPNAGLPPGPSKDLKHGETEGKRGEQAQSSAPTNTVSWGQG
eukprot:2923891-Amphidinium_carterae.2